MQFPETKTKSESFLHLQGSERKDSEMARKRKGELSQKEEKDPPAFMGQTNSSALLLVLIDIDIYRFFFLFKGHAKENTPPSPNPKIPPATHLVP